MPPKFKGPKLPKIPICTTPEPAPVVPVDLDKHTTITIDNETFDIEADDLEVICELGRGAYGVVEKMKHKKNRDNIGCEKDHCHCQQCRAKTLADGPGYFHAVLRL